MSGCDGHGCFPPQSCSLRSNAGITIAPSFKRQALACASIQVESSSRSQYRINNRSTRPNHWHTGSSTNSVRSGSTSALSRLERDREPVPLPPKAFDLLLLLARNTDRVMSKAELMEALWPNTFVEDANLTQHVYRCARRLATCQTDSRSSRPCRAVAIVLPHLCGKSSLQLPPARLSGRVSARRASRQRPLSPPALSRRKASGSTPPSSIAGSQMPPPWWSSSDPRQPRS